MNTIKSNLIRTALSAILLSSTISYAAVEPTEAEQENARIPTEELIEGIKSRDGRWFEVELIIFQHTGEQAQREQFEDEVTSVKPERYWPLLDEKRQYDVSLLLNALPSCLSVSDPLLQQEQSPEEFYRNYVNTAQRLSGGWYQDELMCLTPDESLSPFWQLIVAGEISERRFDLTLPEPVAMPKRLTGPDFDDFRDVYLIAPQNLQLTEEYEKLENNKNIKPLLHLGWRQPGLSKRRAMPVYLYGGKNWTPKFYYDGTPTPPEVDQVDEIETLADADFEPIDQGLLDGPNLIETERTSVDRFMEKLQQGAVVDFKTNKLVFPDTTGLPQETWEFDGYVTVHLNHYLFLDAEFNFREQESQLVDTGFVLSKDNLLEDSLLKDGEQVESANQEVVIQTLSQNDLNQESPIAEELNSEMMEIKYLQTYSLKQNRRTYSGDLHYLDHPKLGILFQIRKYRH